MLLQDRIYIVTGAASGIGRATAFAIAAQGGKLVLSDVNLPGVEATAQMVIDEGGDACAMRVDVTNAAQVAAFVQMAVDQFGGLDGAVNNAGIGGSMNKMHDVDETEWDQVMAVNLKGVWLCMKHEVQRLRPGKAAIVNIASAAGLVGLPYAAAYTASKHGVIGLTKAAALEYAKRGLRINAVCPGFTETAMVTEMDTVRPGTVATKVSLNPMKRLGEPSEIAAAIIWLLSDESSFVNGHGLVVDGGIIAS